MKATGRASAHLADTALWALVPAVLLSLRPVGRLSGDGLTQAAMFHNGGWVVNPNHLLYEPAGAAWLAVTAKLGFSRPPVDQLVLLSVLAGCVTVALFRGILARRLAASRLGANVATLWVAGASAYDRMWLSSEVHMIQLPWLVLAAAAAIAYSDTRRVGLAFASGAMIGIATLFFVSNSLLALTIPAAFLLFRPAALRERWRPADALVIPCTAALVAFAGLAIAWAMTSHGDASLVSWVTTYSGGHSGSRVVASYGTHLDLQSIGIAVVRAVYGAASSLVDMSRVGGVVRGRHGSLALIASTTAVAAAAWLTLAGAFVSAARTRGARPAISVALAIAAAVLAFAVYWNNSDDQFYFQLALAFGLIVASADWSRPQRWLLVGSTILVIWNSTSGWKMITYPRSAYSSALGKALTGTNLVVYPGNDEAAQILAFVPAGGSQRRIAITALASRMRLDSGMVKLRNEVSGTLERGGRVAVINVLDDEAGAQPWPRLAELGYGRSAVLGAFDGLQSSAPVWAGPFRVRYIWVKQSTPATGTR